MSSYSSLQTQFINTSMILFSFLHLLTWIDVDDELVWWSFMNIELSGWKERKGKKQRKEGSAMKDEWFLEESAFLLTHPSLYQQLRHHFSPYSHCSRLKMYPKRSLFKRFAWPLFTIMKGKKEMNTHTYILLDIP